MPTVIVPKLTRSMERGTLTKWLKEVGEEVSEGDPIAELQLEFEQEGGNTVTLNGMQMRAEEAGSITEHMASEGETVNVGEPIAFIHGEDEENVKTYRNIEEIAADEVARDVGNVAEPAAKQGAAAEAPKRTEGRKSFFDTVLGAQAVEGQSPTSEMAIEGNEATQSAPQEEGIREGSTATRRLNVVFSETAYDELKELADKSGKTISDVVRDAIALQKWFNDIQSGSGRILVEQGGRVREVINVR